MGGTHQQHCLSLCLLFDSLNCILKVHTSVTILYPIVSRDSSAIIPVLPVPIMTAMGCVGMGVIAGRGCVVIAVSTLVVIITTYVADRASVVQAVYFHIT